MGLQNYNLQERSFAQAMAEISVIIGPENLIQDPEKVRIKSEDIIPRTRQALAFAYPANIEQIQKILAVANQHLLPIWPVSQGKNWGYGGASPSENGTLVLGLEKMNKILEVNTELAFAVVEPGVSFRQLHSYLIENNIPLWIDCTDGPPEGSVMGNSLERGIGETDYGDHFGNICGMEVVLPDGTMLRTGGGPMENFRSWNTYKWGVGPSLDGLFSQSNFGIVTKMGVWLRPKPEKFLSCLFELKDPKNFSLLIDGLRHLQLQGVLQSKVHLINEVATRAVSVEDYNDPEQTLRGYKLPSWSFAAGLYGSHEQVRINARSIRAVLGPLGTLQFIDETKLKIINGLSRRLRSWKNKKALSGLSDWICQTLIGKPLPLMEILPHIHAIEQGYPNDHFVKHAYLKSKTPKPKTGDADPVRDHCGLVWFGPMVPLTGPAVSELLAIAEPLYKKFNFEFYVALMVGNARTAIVLLSIFYDKTNPTETARAENLYFALGKITQDQGYQQYRTSTLYMDKVFANAPEFLGFCKKLKKAIDPNGILAPGKYGI
jgi:4-cresol dehydrogenase (hydroxylating)